MTTDPTATQFIDGAWVPSSDGGTLASDEALAALREKLTGN